MPADGGERPGRIRQGRTGSTRHSEGDTTTSKLFVLFAREKNKQIDILQEQASARGQEAGIIERRRSSGRRRRGVRGRVGRC